MVTTETVRDAAGIVCEDVAFGELRIGDLFVWGSSMGEILRAWSSGDSMGARIRCDYRARPNPPAPDERVIRIRIVRRAAFVPAKK